MGYIGGIYEGVILHDDYANAVRSAQGDEKEVRTWCAPSNISYEDMAAYLVEFLNHNPRYVTNRIHAEVTVYAFFSDKFSCSTS